MGRVREHLSRDQQRHARTFGGVERQVEAFFRADPAQSQHEIALGMPRLQAIDRHAARDGRLHVRQSREGLLLRRRDAVEPSARPRRRYRAGRVEFSR